MTATIIPAEDRFRIARDRTDALRLATAPSDTEADRILEARMRWMGMIDDGLSDDERLARTLKRKRTARGIANAKAAAKANVGRIPEDVAAKMRARFDEDPLR